MAKEIIITGYPGHGHVRTHDIEPLALLKGAPSNETRIGE